MVQEIWGLKRSQEHKLWLLNHQLVKLLLSQFDVGTHLLHYLDPVLVRHLEIQQANTDRANIIVQTVVLVDRLVNQPFALIYRYLPVDTHNAQLFY